MSVYVGLIICDDRPGLVHQITGTMFRRQLNVTQNQEFVDHDARRFFMRTQIDGDVDVQELLAELKSLLPPGSFCSLRELKSRRLVLLASRELHCLGDLLVRHNTGDFKADIAAVISQHDDCEDLVNRFGIPFRCIKVVGADRAKHEQLILKAIEPLAPDYLILARYMRIFSKEFVSHFPERIVNIHHSFLPAFIGKDPYHQAHERGVKIIGATAHFVTESLDEGPIITQDVVSVDHTCDPMEMARRGQDVEKIVLSRALNLVLQDRVLIDGNRTVVFA